MPLIPTKRIRLYGLDLVVLVIGYALLWLWIYPVLGMCLVIASLVIGTVVAVINSRIAP
jgi:hypothetical protein